MSDKYRFCPDCGAQMEPGAAPDGAGAAQADSNTAAGTPEALPESFPQVGAGTPVAPPAGAEGGVAADPGSGDVPVAEVVPADREPPVPFAAIRPDGPPSPFRRRPPPRRRLAGAISPSGLKLGPLDVGGVISNSFSILFKGFGTYAVIALCMAFPINLVGGLLGVYIPKAYGGEGPQFGQASVMAGTIMVSVFSYFATAFVIGCMTHSIAKNYLGESVGVGSSILKSLSVMHVIFVSTVISGILMYGGFAIAIPFAVRGNPDSMIIAGLVALAWVVPLVFLALVFYVQIPPIMIEGAGPIEALKRSHAVMNGIKARTVLVVIVVWLLTVAIGCMIGTPLGVLMISAGNSLTVEVISVIARALGQSVGNLIGAAVVVVTYFDGRVRNEGFGLERLADLFA